MAIVVIIGASRGIGLETVKAALAAGHTVRALARSAASIPLDDSRLQKIAGDALRKEDVQRAVTGADAAIQSLGVGSASELAFGTTLFSESTRVLVAAMQECNVRRLIAVTGLGAGNSRGRLGFVYDSILFPLFLKRIYADKDIAEEIVTASGLDWTIVRPGGLTNAPATGHYRVLVDAKSWRFGFISRADVAAFLVSQIDDRSLVGRTPLLIS